MKKKILIVLLLIVSSLTFSQVITRNADAFRVKEENDTQYKLYQDIDVDIIFDCITHQITIYSKVTQNFDILGTEREWEQDGFHVTMYQCLDFYKLKCKIQVWNHPTKRDVVRVIYKDMIYEYQLQDPK